MDMLMVHRDAFTVYAFKTGYNYIGTLDKTCKLQHLKHMGSPIIKISLNSQSMFTDIWARLVIGNVVCMTGEFSPDQTVHLLLAGGTGRGASPGRRRGEMREGKSERRRERRREERRTTRGGQKGGREETRRERTGKDTVERVTGLVVPRSMGFLGTTSQPLESAPGADNAHKPVMLLFHRQYQLNSPRLSSA